MTPLNQEFAHDPMLSKALSWDPEDATLSSGERALTTIVHCLTAYFDVLDGAQQRTLVTALKTQTEATEKAEDYARQLLTQ